MKLRFFGSTPADHPRVIQVLVVLFLFGFARYLAAPGDDLAASYIGCRVLAAGDPDDLYSYDPETFSEIDADDTAWHRQADASGFIGYLHPYVQTPLWAWSLRPLCTTLRFPAFNILFEALCLLSFVGIAYLVARFWAPSLLNPIALAVILLLFSRSEPFRYAMVLMQTHVLYLFLTVASLLLAERRRPLAAGALLALAAAVKITPGVLVLYWLLTRRYRAAASMVVCSAALLLAAVLITGSGLFSTYLADLQRISHVLLVSANNQSFAAWSMGRFFPPDEVDELVSHVLPNSIRLGGNLLLVASILIGGLIDRSAANASSVAPRSSRTRTHPPSTGAPGHPPVQPPLGAMFALVGLTVFSPIAWTHYYIVLLPPVMLLLHQFHTRSLRTGRRSEVWLLVLTLTVCLFNFRPFAGNVVDAETGLLGLLRIHFYSGVLCLVTLALAAWKGRRLPATLTAAPTHQHSHPEAVTQST